MPAIWRSLEPPAFLTDELRDVLGRRLRQLGGLATIAAAGALGTALATWSAQDPSFTHATKGAVRNALGWPGAALADLLMQLAGLASVALLVPMLMWGWRLVRQRSLGRERLRLFLWVLGLLAAAAFASSLPAPARWPLPSGLGGVTGDALLRLPTALAGGPLGNFGRAVFAGGALALALAALFIASGFGWRPANVAEDDLDVDEGTDDRGGLVRGWVAHALLSARARLARTAAAMRERVAHPDLPDAREGARRRFEPALRAPAVRGQAPREPSFRDAPRREPLRREPARQEPARPEPEPFDPEEGESRWEEPAPPPAPAFALERKRGTVAAAPPPPDDDDDEEAGAMLRARDDAEDDEPAFAAYADEEADEDEGEIAAAESRPTPAPPPPPPAPKKLGPLGSIAKRALGAPAPAKRGGEDGYELPPPSLLANAKPNERAALSMETIQENAGTLEGVLEDFGVRGEIINARPGPVVTLYELEPAPGIKSSRVIGLADDIARSMSAVSARVAVVPGRNVIGIELPNPKREKVYLRELLAATDYENTAVNLPLCLGKTICGESVIVDLARMPHLLIAGTTGSGKSVAINTMILSLLYRLKPEQCRLIMVDPKMLELSVYDGIPHLLTPVVTDPKKAVTALKWAVREMEDRYRKMSKLGVRNVAGYNARVAEAKAKGETLTRTVHTGYDKESGEAIYEEETLDLDALPYLVVIVDEMADLMMVAGKEIEGAIQRLAQMARAAGIHVILATQRPSVDVITGTIKANFPTRISFQVTSKIDSRTILGEQGAEQLLGQGDMLYMAGGGRISRVHGPFVADEEVEKVVRHLKSQGQPQYLDAVTAGDGEDEGDGEDGAVFDATAMGADGGGDPYAQAVQIVLRDRKASTSYIQRRLQIGYNRAASIMERMEKEGIVGPANHAGKREILTGGGDDAD